MSVINVINKMAAILFDEHQNYNFYDTNRNESQNLKINIIKKKQRKEKLCKF